MASGKRLLGKYFRVAFFGRKFGDDDGKEYVYKEPKITSLSEISHRMETMYSRKYGSDTIKLILESSKVLGPVVQKPISTNPGLSFYPMFLFPTIQRLFRAVRFELASFLLGTIRIAFFKNCKQFFKEE